MCNIYMTTESEYKLKQIFSNLKNFFVLDIDAFVRNMNVDLTKQTSIYLVNSEIEKTILAQAKLKKYQGIIYINKNLSKELHDSVKTRFKNAKDINKLVLIDNGQFPKHLDLMNIFEEVLFYERFKKNKIIECSGFTKNPDDTLSLLMEDIPGDK